MNSAVSARSDSDNSDLQSLEGRSPSSPGSKGNPLDLAIWAEVSHQLKFPEFTDGDGLSEFLALYQQHVLQAVEFPAILKAWHLTQQGHAKDLIALDLELGKDPRLTAFGRASCLIGRRQLRRLRPLRDHRVIQRYLAAVDAGKANAWNPLVFGMTLAVFSLPPRQGLQRYGEECLCGLTTAAATARRLPQMACRQGLNRAFTTLPTAIENVMSPQQ